MRIGIIVTEFPKITETFILRDLVEFRRKGHEIRIYHMSRFRRNEVVHDFARETILWTRPQPYLLGKDVILAMCRAIVYSPLKVLRIVRDLLGGFWKNPEMMLKSFFLLPKCLAFAEDLNAWSADHVHAEFATHPATCAWITGRMAGLPYSVSCRAHDIFVSQAMLDLKLGEAAFIRTISEFNQRFLKEQVPVIRQQPFVVIHSSIDTVNIPALPLPSEISFKVLTVGALESRKGIDVLLKALRLASSQLEEWQLDIIGEGGMRKTLEILADKLGLSSHIQFHGAQPFEAVSRAYAHANVVVMPSIIGKEGRTEGIPNVTIEALAYQRPVIASSISGIPELIIDGETGYLFRAGDAEDLADVLVKVKNYPARAYRLAKQGRQHVEAEFDLRHNAGAQLTKFEQYSLRNSKGAAR